MNQLSQTRTGYALSASAGLVWALTSPGIKYLLDVYHVPEILLAFWRDVFIALVCLGVLLVVRPQMLRVSRADLRGFALIGAISIGVYHALWVLSIALNGAAVAIVLIYTFPTFVTLGSWLIFHEPLRRPQLVALGLSLLGCALLVRIYDPAVLRLSGLGALVGLGSAITHAGYVLFSQRSVKSYSPWTSLTYTMLFGSVVLLVLSLFAGASAPASPATSNLPYLLQVGTTPTPWLILLAVALGPTLGGYAIFTLSLRYVPARVASLVSVIEAPIATMVAVVLLGEHIEFVQCIGIALILASIVLPQVWAYVVWRIGNQRVGLASEASDAIESRTSV